MPVGNSVQVVILRSINSKGLINRDRVIRKGGIRCVSVPIPDKLVSSSIAHRRGKDRRTLYRHKVNMQGEYILHL